MLSSIPRPPWPIPAAATLLAVVSADLVVAGLRAGGTQAVAASLVAAIVLGIAGGLWWGSPLARWVATLIPVVHVIDAAVNIIFAGTSAGPLLRAITAALVIGLLWAPQPARRWFADQTVDAAGPAGPVAYSPYRIAVIACAAGFAVASLGAAISDVTRPDTAPVASGNRVGLASGVASLVLATLMFGCFVIWLSHAGVELRGNGRPGAELRLGSVRVFGGTALVLLGLVVVAVGHQPPGSPPSVLAAGIGSAADAVRVVLGLAWIALAVSVGHGIDDLLHEGAAVRADDLAIG